MVKINMKKILKFDSNAKLISFPFYADYLGVLQAYNYNVDDILVNNLLTMYYSPKIQQIGFRNFKCLQKLMKIEALFLDNNVPIESIKNYIDNNKYVEIILNGKYLPFVNVDKDKFHDWLIIGYDDDEKRFIGYGYTKSKEGVNRYSKVFINYADFVSAIPAKTIKTGFENNIMYNHYVYLRSTNNDSFLSKIKVKEFPEIITFRSLGKNSLNYESQKINCIVKYILPDDKRIEVGSINCITNKSQHSLVIGIGRGVNKETINKLCMLSKEYNIKVVCTKPLVENKTFLFENQVGQSGFTICPDVYLALGISGSIQHLLGIKNCKKIIAVNTDELANIHSVANFSIIQDCNIFVDKLIEYIEKRKQLKGV